MPNQTPSSSQWTIENVSAIQPVPEASDVNNRQNNDNTSLLRIENEHHALSELPSNPHHASLTNDQVPVNNGGNSLSTIDCTTDSARGGVQISSLNGSVKSVGSRPGYKKTTEIIKILPEFDGQNISINQFIRKCKDAESFADPADKNFFIRLVESKVIGDARAYLQYKTFHTLDQLLAELKRTFAPMQTLPQIQTDFARVMQKQSEKVSENGLRVTKMLQKAIEYINENYEISVARECWRVQLTRLLNVLFWD